MMKYKNTLSNYAKKIAIKKFEDARKRRLRLLNSKRPKEIYDYGTVEESLNDTKNYLF